MLWEHGSLSCYSLKTNNRCTRSRFCKSSEQLIHHANSAKWRGINIWALVSGPSDNHYSSGSVKSDIGDPRFTAENRSRGMFGLPLDKNLILCALYCTVPKLAN